MVDEHLHGNADNDDDCKDDCELAHELELQDISRSSFFECEWISTHQVPKADFMRESVFFFVFLCKFCIQMLSTRFN